MVDGAPLTDLMLCCLLLRELQQTITMNIYRTNKIKGKNELREKLIKTWEDLVRREKIIS
jgi:hypothetical protein